MLFIFSYQIAVTIGDNNFWCLHGRYKFYTKAHDCYTKAPRKVILSCKAKNVDKNGIKPRGYWDFHLKELLFGVRYTLMFYTIKLRKGVFENS